MKIYYWISNLNIEVYTTLEYVQAFRDWTSCRKDIFVVFNFEGFACRDWIPCRICSASIYWNVNADSTQSSWIPMQYVSFKYNIASIILSLSVFPYTAKHHRNRKGAVLPRVRIPKVLSESNLIQDSWQIGNRHTI